MARRQNVRDRIGMAVYEKKKLNKKLVTMQKSFQEVKHLIGDEKNEKINIRRLQRRISGVNALCCFGLFFDAERFRFSAGSQQIFTLHQCFVPSNSNGCRCSGSDSSRF